MVCDLAFIRSRERFLRLCAGAAFVVGLVGAVKAEDARANSVAQTDPRRVAPSAPFTREVSFDEFMTEVLAGNLDYAAQRFNVEIAQADAAAAHLLPNPTLGLNANRDLTFHGKTALDQNGRS